MKPFTANRPEYEHHSLDYALDLSESLGVPFSVVLSAMRNPDRRQWRSLVAAFQATGEGLDAGDGHPLGLFIGIKNAILLSLVYGFAAIGVFATIAAAVFLYWTALSKLPSSAASCFLGPGRTPFASRLR